MLHNDEARWTAWKLGIPLQRHPWQALGAACLSSYTVASPVRCCACWLWPGNAPPLSQSGTQTPPISPRIGFVCLHSQREELLHSLKWDGAVLLGVASKDGWQHSMRLRPTGVCCVFRLGRSGAAGASIGVQGPELESRRFGVKRRRGAVDR